MANDKRFWESKSFWFGLAEMTAGVVMWFSYDKATALVLIGLGLSTLGIRDAQQVERLFRFR